MESDVGQAFDFCCTVQLKDAKAPVLPASLLLGYKPGAKHLALTLTSDTLTLARVAQEPGGASRASNVTVLARVRKPWYTPPTTEGARLVTQWRKGRLHVIYAGRVLLKYSGLEALKGAVAIAPGEGNLQFGEPRCQPVEPLHFADDFMRAASEPGLWQNVSGSWRLNTVGTPTLGANPFAYAAQGKPATTVTGHWFWSDYTVSVSVRPCADGAVGVVFYYQDPANYLLFKWLADNHRNWRGKEKQCWKVVRGQPSLVSASAGGYRPNQWYRLSVRTQEGLVKIAVDGHSVLQARTELFGQGKAGLYREGDSDVLFDDVLVRSAGTEGMTDGTYCEPIVPQFTQEQTMENWATPKAEWLPSSIAPATTFWHRGAFFGDHTLVLKATGMVSGAKLTGVVSGDGESPTSGYALVVTPTANNQSVETTLLRQGKPVSSHGSAKVATATVCPLKLQRSGNTVRGFIGAELVASFTDPKPLTGRRAGYVAQGAQVLPNDARVTGGHVYDYTFYRAPTDWHVGSGTWEVASRWLCSPQWSWYGGWSDRIAAIWNKRSFAGDLVVEVFVASKMDSAGPPHYLHPRDLNITIAGDGSDPASGYSCIFGGWNNTFTRLLRGPHIVAESNQVLLPAKYHDAAHRKWFCLRVEKTGETVSFYVDRKLTLRYKDPQPLTGRKVCLWTYGNGVMIARATIYCQKATGLELMPTEAEFRGNYPGTSYLVRGVAVGSTGKLTAKLPRPKRHAPDARPSTPAAAIQAPMTPKPEVNPVAVASQPASLERGLFNVKATYCKEPDLGVLKSDLRNQRIPWPCFKKRIFTQTVDTIDYDWTDKSPGSGMATNYWSARFVGKLLITEEGSYVFSLDRLDDGGRLYMNGRLVIDAWLLQPPTTHASEPVHLTAGVHDVRLDYCQGTLAGSVALSWSGPGFTKQVIPKTVQPDPRLVANLSKPQPHTPSGGAVLAGSTTTPSQAPVGQPAAAQPLSANRGLFNLKATYCKDRFFGDLNIEMLNQPIPWPCLKKPLFARSVDVIDFDWTDTSPGRGMPGTYWSARFAGKLLVAEEGDYVFYLDRLDDGGRLYVDGKPVIEMWILQPPTTHPSQPVHLTVGVHDLRLDYCQGILGSSVTLSWSGPGFAKETIPKAAKPGSEAPVRVAAKTR
ncbi:MAG: hypothetical protein HY318_15325 [Armatimonadetes bacterium]|nr:hypothetical protein [Armatimonadota bacterium]